MKPRIECIGHVEAAVLKKGSHLSFEVDNCPSLISIHLTRKQKETLMVISELKHRPSLVLLIYVTLHARIRSWNQPVLSNECNASCSRKQHSPVT